MTYDFFSLSIWLTFQRYIHTSQWRKCFANFFTTFLSALKDSLNQIADIIMLIQNHNHFSPNNRIIDIVTHPLSISTLVIIHTEIPSKIATICQINILPIFRERLNITRQFIFLKIENKKKKRNIKFKSSIQTPMTTTEISFLKQIKTATRCSIEIGKCSAKLNSLT